MRFKLDENLPGDLARLLAAFGHDAQTVVEEGMRGSSDPQVLAAAADEGRVLITFDVGLGDPRRHVPPAGVAIVVLRLPDHRWPAIETRMRAVLRGIDWGRVSGSLLIVGPTRIRVRRRR